MVVLRQVRGGENFLRPFCYIKEMKIIAKNLEETKDLAEKFIKSLQIGDRAVVVALTGDLGSGKTTFSQFIGRALGVEEHIQSPTFLIERIYELKDKPWKHFVHIDAYRLDSSQELITLGWEKLLENKENLILIEWPERVSDIIPEYAYHIVFRHVTEDTREIEVQGQKGQ